MINNADLLLCSISSFFYLYLVGFLLHELTLNKYLIDFIDTQCCAKVWVPFKNQNSKSSDQAVKLNNIRINFVCLSKHNKYLISWKYFFYILTMSHSTSSIWLRPQRAVAVLFILTPESYWILKLRNILWYKFWQYCPVLV